VMVLREIMIAGTCIGGLFYSVLLGLYVTNHYYLASINLSSIEVSTFSFHVILAP